MYNADKEYLTLVDNILKRGISRSDRTGTGTIGLPFQQMRFDLTNHKIPLLTTKKMFTRGIIHEILWYLQGNTSSHELERNGVNIWQEWKDENGELGLIYGHQWRSWTSAEDVVPVSPRIIEKTNPPSNHNRFPPQTPESTNDSFVGRVFYTSECGPITVLCQTKQDNEHNDHCYAVQFLHTGFIKKDIRSSVIRRGHIIDPYLQRVSGVGYLGEYDKEDPNLKMLQRRWYHILDRCYNSSTAEYQLYGGAGIFVDPSWHCFATFQHDVKYLPNWNNARINPSEYDLDKDYYSSNCYSKNTCVWLMNKDNMLYRKNPTPFIVTTPDGYEFIELSISRVCEKYDLTYQLVHKCISGQENQHKGFKFRPLTDLSPDNYRYTLPIDQVADVINKLRTNPTDRRIIISSWNVADIPKMALPPCHAFVQFWSDGNALHSHLYQRSCDVGIGVPFNIVQYSILTHMFAHITGLQATEFVWTGGDCHVYNNHKHALIEQLHRDYTKYPAPTLELNPAVGEIDNFKFEDFKIVGYESYPTIKMDVSV